MLNKIKNLDRRFIFLLVGISALILIVFPINFPVEVGQQAKNIFNFIEKLPGNSIVLVGFDYYATTTVECNPMAYAVSRHLFRKNCKIIITSLIPDGASLSQKIMQEVAQEYKKKYGKDYVILGYKAGVDAAIIQIFRDLKKISPKDVFGTPISKIPLMWEFKNYKDLALVFSVADNASLDRFIVIGYSQFKVPVGGGTTAVGMPGLYNYINSGQTIGILGGLKGASEYENLMNYKGLATSGMGIQSALHLLIVGLILFTNIIYFIDKKKSGRIKS